MDALQDTRRAAAGQATGWKPLLRRSGFQPDPPSPEASARERHFSLARLAGAAALVILAGYLLFAHGCHGDEDNELFSIVRWVAQRSP
jgi:hypothetical protein